MQKHKLSIYVIISFFTLFSESALAVMDSYINKSENPTNNFFKHATNGPAAFTSLFEDAEDALKQKISACIQNNAKSENKVGNMYRSLINKESYQKTLDEVKKMFAEIDSIGVNDKSGIVKEIARLNKLNVLGGIGIIVEYPDATSPLAVYIVPGDDIINFKEIPNTFFNTIDIANVEKVKSLNEDLVKLRNIKGSKLESFNKVPISDLTIKNPDFWTPYFTAHQLFGKVSEVYIEPTTTTSVINLLYGNKAYSVSEWKTYLKFSYLNSVSDILEQQNLMHRDNLDQERVRLIFQRRLASELGRLCFVEEMKNQAEALEIAKNIISTYQSSIIAASYINESTSEKWISDNTKNSMLEKLSNIRPELGYEQLIATTGFSNLKLNSDDPLDNVKKLMEIEYQYRMDQINSRTGHSAHWGTSITDTSPTYMATENIIVIPLGALIEPLFVKDNSAFNYAVFGFFFSHEVGHAFDLDMVNDPSYVWKVKADKDIFADKIKKLEQQYSKYHNRSKITISEDVADNLGFPMTRIAYQVFLKKQTQKKEENTSNIMVFYYDFAQLFTKLINSSTDDPHSSGEDRVNGVLKNHDEFYDIFNVGPKDKMFIAPKYRVKFW